MNVAIMQPYLFPYIGYFQLIAAADTFVVYDDVAFINRGWINRNRVLQQGRELLVTVPLRAASQNRTIREIEIAEDGLWLPRVLRTVEHAYARAPRFPDTYALAEAVLGSKERSISRMAVSGLRAVCTHLGITTRFVESSTVYGNSALKGQERILDICAREGATRYINLPGGAALYSRAEFAARGVELEILEPDPGPYRQFGDPFVPWLSILDVLMFNSREESLALVASERARA
jgi:hypothetical protein